jgi:hypothetical protein
VQGAEQGLSGLWPAQDVGDLPLTVEDEGGWKTVQPVAAARHSVRIDQVRIRQVVLSDERTGGTSSIRPVDANQPGASPQLAGHSLQLRRLLETWAAPAGPEVDRGRLASEGCECHLGRNEHAGRQPRSMTSGPEAGGCPAHQHDRNHRADGPATGSGRSSSVGRWRGRSILVRSRLPLMRDFPDRTSQRLPTQAATAALVATTPSSCRRPISASLRPSTSASTSSVCSPSSGARRTGTRST